MLCSHRMMNLWVALAEGGVIASYNPMSGKQLGKVCSYAFNKEIHIAAFCAGLS